MIGWRLCVLLLIVGAWLLGGVACRDEGPAETAGRKIDEALEDLRHGDEGTMERAGRELDEAMEQTGESAEELREAAREKARELERELDEAAR